MNRQNWQNNDVVVMATAALAAGYKVMLGLSTYCA